MDQFYVSIGKRISKLRAIRGLTQSELAERLDVTTKHVSSVECGKSAYSLEKMVQLCDILDCNLDYLILGRTHLSSTSYIPDSVMTILESGDLEERRLLQEYLSFFTKLRQSNSDT